MRHFTGWILLGAALCASAAAQDGRIKAFCVDFNWGSGGPNGFAAPGLFAQADPKTHVAWYKALGVNTIQTFCVSCNGYAWYRSELIPPQPGMAGDFLSEVTALAHAEGMRVMGYFCVGANTRWAQENPELSYGNPSAIHIPLSTEYVDFLCASIRDVLERTAIDGFMLDWFFNPPCPPHAKLEDIAWMPCERQMYEELFGEPFPGPDKVSEERIIEYNRRAVERCWRRVRETAKAVKPDCILWVSCFDLEHPQVKDSRMLREVDWLMNEHFNPELLESVRKQAGAHTKLIQCVCGWGDSHNAPAIMTDPRMADVGIYGFAMPDEKTTLPPEDINAADGRLAGNARNIEAMRKAFHADGQ